MGLSMNVCEVFVISPLDWIVRRGRQRLIQRTLAYKWCREFPRNQPRRASSHVAQLERSMSLLNDGS